MKKTITLLLAVTTLLLSSCTNEQDDLGVGTFTYAYSDTLLIDGAAGKLHTIVDSPDLMGNAERNYVILLHGFQGSKDSSLHRMLRDTLLAHQFIVVRFDYHGQGMSEGKFKEMTVPMEMEDTRCIYNWLKKEYYAKNISLVGHSLGGVIASMFAAEKGKDSIQSVVMIAPAPSVRNMLISGRFWGAEFNSVNPPDSMAIWNNGTLGGEFVRTLRDMPIYELSAPYRGRACLIHGNNDWLIPYTDSETYHLLWPQSEYHLIDNCEHLFYGHYPEVADIVTNFLMNSSCQAQ